MIVNKITMLIEEFDGSVEELYNLTKSGDINNVRVHFDEWCAQCGIHGDQKLFVMNLFREKVYMSIIEKRNDEKVRKFLYPNK